MICFWLDVIASLNADVYSFSWRSREHAEMYSRFLKSIVKPIRPLVCKHSDAFPLLRRFIVNGIDGLPADLPHALRKEISAIGKETVAIALEITKRRDFQSGFGMDIEVASAEHAARAGPSRGWAAAPVAQQRQPTRNSTQHFPVPLFGERREEPWSPFLPGAQDRTVAGSFGVPPPPSQRANPPAQNQTPNARTLRSQSTEPSPSRGSKRKRSDDPAEPEEEREPTPTRTGRTTREPRKKKQD